MGKGFEDYMNIVEQAHTKTAAAKSGKVSSELLAKLAGELTKQADEGAAVASATAGAKPADSSVAGAAPAVVAATEAATATQLALAGANPAEPVKGEMPAPTKPNEGVVITDAAGKVTDANALNKVPAAVVAAAEPTAKAESVEKTAELKRAEEIGVAMANAYVDQLEKIAYDRQYNEALAFLQERGVLADYKING